LVTLHSINLTGLTASTTYHYNVMSHDALGNLTQSGDLTFTTTAAPTGSQSQVLLQLHSDASEVSGVTNGSIVTPAIAPPGFLGQVVVNGGGSVNFAPAQTGNGVYFLQCCDNLTNAYYKFTGATVGSIFNVNQGQITFYLKSRQSFAQRLASDTSYRQVFDVRDASTHLFEFNTQAVYGYLRFDYTLAGTQAYYIPSPGTEEVLFGNGITLKVTMTWDGSVAKLYLNDALVQQTPYVTPAPNWTAASNFDYGAYEYQTNGGYDSSDDIIDEFTVTELTTVTPPPTLVPTISSLQCAPASLLSNATTTCTVTLSNSTASSTAVTLFTSTSSLLTVPSSVSVAANATSATFTASTGVLVSDQTATVTATLNGSSVAATLSLVSPVTLSSLQCAAASLASNASTTCTVALSKSAAGSTVVALSKSASTLLTIPSSVSVAANATSASFTATAGTLISDQAATVTATLNGSSAATTLSLVSPVTLSSLQCAAASLTSNASTTCTVTLSKSAATSSTVALFNSAPTLLTVPSSVSVAANATTATFTASTGTVTSNQSATVTATLNGSSAAATISLVPPAAPVTVSNLQCAATSLASNASTNCTVTLSKSTTSNTVVSLSSSASSLLLVPSAVTVPANATSAAFPASTGTLASDQTATLTATLNGSSAAVTLTLVAPTAPATLSALQCGAASLASNVSTSCTVTLSKAAPAGGVTVSLSSSLPSLLTVPGTLTVPASANSAAFTASAGTISTSASAVVTVALGTTKLTAAISLQAPVPTQPWTLSCSPTVLTPGISGSCVVSMASPSNSPTTISLKPTNAAFTIANTLKIPAGATSGNAPFTTTSALTGWVILLATSGNVKQTFTFSVSTQSSAAATNLVSLSCAGHVAPGLSTVCDLRLSPSGNSQKAAISLTSTSSRLRIPETLLAEPGQTTIRFEVAADTEATGENAILEARAGDNTVRESLAVIAAGPRLLAPARVAGTPAAAVHFRVSASGGAFITAAGLPTGSVFDANIGAFDWTPSAADLGQHRISFIATDAQGSHTTKSVLVYVGSGAPVLTQLHNLAGGAVCSPGAIASISGWFLSSADTSLTDRSGRSSNLGETRVLVNGAYAPILSATGNQVEFLCPALPSQTPLEIAVETPSGQSSSLQTTMQEIAPAILTVDGSPQGQALAVHASSGELAALPSFRQSARPAQSGERISIWATGIECAASPKLWLNLGGQTVAIDSAQPVSQMAGICEIAFRIPASVAGDSVSLAIETMRSDSLLSSSNRTSVAVQPPSMESNANNSNFEE
jgi:uncharacterized protein (TIGR03437 family)